MNKKIIIGIIITVIIAGISMILIKSMTKNNLLESCLKWFDGCNTCSVINGEIRTCTERYCPANDYNNAECVQYGGVSIINKSQALINIKNQTEVIKYEAELKKAGSKANFEVQDDGENWLVHVFEIVKNGDSPSHTATFNWYRVDKKTGAVNAEF